MSTYEIPDLLVAVSASVATFVISLITLVLLLDYVTNNPTATNLQGYLYEA